MKCRICTAETKLLAGSWHHCDACGSDSADHSVFPYDKDYDEKYAKHCVFEDNLREHRANMDWFVDHSGDCPDRSFLDVGCAEGVALVGMASRGWNPMGFDVNPYSAVHSHGHPVLIAPQFDARFVPKFSGILSREVIEHVDDWRRHLTELVMALKPRGLIEIQTPAPCFPDSTSDNPGSIYIDAHLQIFAHGILEANLTSLGCNVIESRTWSGGQNMIARKK